MQQPYQSQFQFQPQPSEPPCFTETPASTPATRERRPYSTAEAVYAWLCFAAGYAYCRVFPVVWNPLGGFLFVVALFLVTAVILHRRGSRLRGLPLAAALSAIAVSASLLMCADAMLHMVSYAYALVVFFYVVYAAGGNTLQKGFSGLIAADFFRALFVLPLASMGEIFFAAGSGRAKSGGKAFLKVLLGVAVTIVPTTVVCALLSYDSGFRTLLGQIFDFNIGDIFSHVASALLGIPIGMYVFGAYVSAVDGKCKQAVSAEGCQNTWRAVKIVPTVTVTVAVLPLLVLYVIFFVSQWNYYISGFMGELPAMTVYSQYARDGFFQLCTVSIINFLMLAAIALFTARKGEKTSWIQRLLSVVLSVFTLVLISTAVAKMVMYIDCYGLTPKRLQASWLMVTLAVLFLLVILQQFVRKLKLLPLGMCVCVILYGALALSGADTLIARYNVDRYLNGTLKEVDISAMEELGDAAVPELVRLVKHLDAQNGTDISQYEPKTDEDYYDYDVAEPTLYEQAANALYRVAAEEDDSLFSFTIPRFRAKAALKEAGITVD
ncbi:MAG: DUF4173 domain-containing protein [Clostridia bacterium]|nr:DUF4173 domain-containing protein [Clostridia bacterium]